MLSSKKGESLVEVTVALGILTLILVSVVSIITGSVTLNLSARQRTEVVARVQKNLNEYLSGNTNQGACSITNRDLGIVASTATCSLTDLPLTDSDNTCYYIEIVDLSTSNPNETTLPGYDAATSNFVKVISHGFWYTRVLGQQEFQISRVVRNR